MQLGSISNIVGDIFPPFRLLGLSATIMLSQILEPTLIPKHLNRDHKYTVAEAREKYQNYSYICLRRNLNQKEMRQNRNENKCSITQYKNQVVTIYRWLSKIIVQFYTCFLRY